MKDFPIIPAGKNSISNRKPIFGVGINDADYVTQPIVIGGQITCPIYRKWKDMLRRCHCEKHHERQPTYKDCTVCNEWLTFSNFRRWMITQDWENKQLDKDLKISGNKVYSPETCIFVTHQINSLLCDGEASRGDHPNGVSYRKDLERFHSRCNFNGVTVHIGFFDSSKEAATAYKEFKSKLVLSIADEQSEPLKSYLIRMSKEVLIG